MTKNQKPKPKTQNYKSKFKNIRFWIVILIFDICILNFPAYAKEITILYTGETHAMLYPCSCPKEPGGGVARRANLIKQLRKNNPHILLLDSGGFFAGGLLDEYTQDRQLDMQRTQINLKAMQFMGYDAVAIGDNEFNFGREFLEENIGKTKMTFLSCNIKSQMFLPYLIKEIAGTKIGIIGVTSVSTRNKAEGLEFIEPKVALKQAMQELKDKGVNFIVVLSQLGEAEDLRLINEVEGIDILIAGGIPIPGKKELPIKAGSILILRPSWQGRQLDKLSLVLKDDKIANYKVESIRLSDDIPDDAGALSILPRCFSDSDCKKKGLVGMCKDAGTLNSQCLFTEASKVSLLIITPKVCSVCNTERMLKYLKSQFPGLVVSYLYYPDTETNKLIKDFGIKGLPVYLLGKEAEKEKNFDSLKRNVDLKGNFYILKPEFSGLSYFLNRKRIKGKLDLFISLYDKNTAILLDTVKDFNPLIHFLAIETHGGFDSRYGSLEVEDYLRSVCVQKYYPKDFLDYISCRAKFINSSWWEDCLGNLDTDKIKVCARTDEGSLLLKENINLNSELEIMLGPTYFLENVEIFSTLGEPSREELEKIIKR